MKNSEDAVARAVSDACKKGRRLKFKFVGEDYPELDEVEFCQRTGAVPKKLARTGLTESFRWDQFARAFSLFFICYLLWAKRQGSDKFIFHGKRKGSVAATLGDGISQPHNKFHQLLEGGLKGFFYGVNVHGKGKGERQIWVRHSGISPARLYRNQMDRCQRQRTKR